MGFGDVALGAVTTIPTFVRPSPQWRGLDHYPSCRREDVRGGWRSTSSAGWHMDEKGGWEGRGLRFAILPAPPTNLINAPHWYCWRYPSMIWVNDGTRIRYEVG